MLIPIITKKMILIKMIREENILNFRTRKNIYNFISENPGLNLRELSRRTNLSLGVLRHHLNHLKKRDLIIAIKNHRYTGYYVKKNFSQRDIELINLLRQDVPRRIIQLLIIAGPGEIFKNRETWKKAKRDPKSYWRLKSKRELVGATKYWGERGKDFHLIKHRTTIDFHLQKLLDADLIEKIKIGKEIMYRLKDEGMVVEFLVKYQDALSNQAITRHLRGINAFMNNNMNFFMDNLERNGYDIFPHPFYG